MTKPKAPTIPAAPKAAPTPAAGTLLTLPPDQDVKRDLRAALAKASPGLSEAVLDRLVEQAMQETPSAPSDGAPKFKERPRYKLLEKAWLGTVKVRQGDDWVPFENVLLDPEEQPIAKQLSGPFGGRGTPERVPLEIEFLGIPDEHMQPLNDAANWMMDNIDDLKARAQAQAGASRRTRRRSRNPVDELMIVGAGASVVRPAAEVT